jgi:NADH-quinone oxidoreductase subunit L
VAEGHAIELGLMALSVVIAAAGIGLAWQLYQAHPERAEALAAAWPKAHRILLNKYYVDELYGALFVRGAALGGGTALHAADRFLVDGGDGEVRAGGGVNGIAWGVRDVIGRASDLWDKWVIDFLVNVTALALEQLSYVFRAVQNGLVQHYAWVMLLGVLLLVALRPLLRP